MYNIARSHGTQESSSSRQTESAGKKHEAKREYAQRDTVGLREYSASDATALYSALDAGRTEIDRYTNLHGLKSAAALDTALKSSTKRHTYTILHNSLPVGTIAARYEDGAKRDAYIGHSWIGANYRGKRIMPRAKAKFYAKEFASGATSVTSQIWPDNYANLKVMERLGIPRTSIEHGFHVYKLTEGHFKQLTQADEGPWNEVESE